MALGLGAFALLWALGRRLGAGLYDDAYIFFRYADNVVAGLGLVYNAGERVEGFTSPAWMALLAGARLLTPDLERVAVVTGLLAASSLAPLVWLGLKAGAGAGGARALPVALAVGLAALPATVFWAHAGMETPLFAAVVTGALVSAMRSAGAGRVTWPTAAWLALAPIVRPEGMLLVAWVGLWATFRHGRLDGVWVRRIAVPLVVALLPFAGLVAARFWYYGALVPNTYVAKVTPDLGGRLARGLRYVGRIGGGHWPLLLAAAALAGAVARRRAVPAAEVGLLAGWVALWTLSLVYLGGDHFPAYRMGLPALPALVLLVGVLARGVTWPRGAAAAFVAVVVVPFGLAAWLGLRAEGGPAGALPRRVAGWAAAGRWIGAHTPPETLVATNVIGAIGYFSRRPILDLSGLVDPVVAREGAVDPGAAPGHGRFHTDHVYARAPDLVIYPTSGQVPGRPFGWTALLPEWHHALIAFYRDPRWRARYEHVAVPLPDGTYVEMDRRRGFPLGVGYLTAPGPPPPE